MLNHDIHIFHLFLVFFLTLIIFVIGLLINRLLSRTTKKEAVNLDVYECGVKPIFSKKTVFKHRYYFIALSFLLFEIELVLLLPVLGIILKPYFFDVKLFFMIEILSFIAIIVLGLLYLIRKKAFDWPVLLRRENIGLSLNDMYQKINEKKYPVVDFRLREKKETPSETVSQKVPSPKLNFKLKNIKK